MARMSMRGRDGRPVQRVVEPEPEAIAGLPLHCHGDPGRVRGRGRARAFRPSALELCCRRRDSGLSYLGR